MLTVSDGIADLLRARAARRHVVVVRNSFPARRPAGQLPRKPSGLVYAGRIGPGRDLETLVGAAPALAAVGVRPVVVGPADPDDLARLQARPPAGRSTSGRSRCRWTRSTRSTAARGSPS